MKFWISWYADRSVAYTLEFPWWVSGARLLANRKTGEMSEQPTVCAAVEADNEEAAKQLIRDAHDSTVSLEWRFCEGRDDDWSPFCDRFQRADWMQWA